jgi:hypothetical protein
MARARSASAFILLVALAAPAHADERAELEARAQVEATYRTCRREPWREADDDCRQAFRDYDHSAWRRGGVLTFVAENDAIVGPDRDYTNGVGVIISMPPRLADPENSVLDRMHDRIDTSLFRFIYGRDTELEDETKRFSFRLAQQLFTPEDLTAPVPDPEDRPYAAWTYASFGRVDDATVLVGDDERLRRRALSATAIELGVVGPSAGGEEVQRWFHHVIDARVDPLGWGYQLNDEMGFALRHERKLITRCEECGRTPFDVEWERHAGFALGNVDASVSAGLGLRLGINMGADYGPTRLQPALDGSSYFVRGPDSRFGGYLFAGAIARGVGRNMFLDGNLFTDSANVQKKHLVGDFQFGAAALLGPVKLSVSHVVRTEEFNGQGRDTQFDAVGVSFRF